VNEAELVSTNQSLRSCSIEGKCNTALNLDGVIFQFTSISNKEINRSLPKYID
jgi:hypothetical protein